MSLKWTPEEVKKEVIQQLLANGQMVGEAVRESAQSNLGGIKDPDWGAGYRSMVAGLVSYEVESEAGGVLVSVGVRGGYSRFHGFYIELGSSRRSAHPWLRPALASNLSRIPGLFAGG